MLPFLVNVHNTHAWITLLKSVFMDQTLLSEDLHVVCRWANFASLVNTRAACSIMCVHRISYF